MGPVQPERPQRKSRQKITSADQNDTRNCYLRHRCLDSSKSKTRQTQADQACEAPDRQRDQVVKCSALHPRHDGLGGFSIKSATLRQKLKSSRQICRSCRAKTRKRRMDPRPSPILRLFTKCQRSASLNRHKSHKRSGIIITTYLMLTMESALICHRCDSGCTPEWTMSPLLRNGTHNCVHTSRVKRPLCEQLCHRSNTKGRLNPNEPVAPYPQVTLSARIGQGSLSPTSFKMSLLKRS